MFTLMLISTLTDFSFGFLVPFSFSVLARSRGQLASYGVPTYLGRLVG